MSSSLVCRQPLRLLGGAHGAARAQRTRWHANLQTQHSSQAQPRHVALAPYPSLTSQCPRPIRPLPPRASSSSKAAAHAHPSASASASASPAAAAAGPLAAGASAATGHDFHSHETSTTHPSSRYPIAITPSSLILYVTAACTAVLAAAANALGSRLGAALALLRGPLTPSLTPSSLRCLCLAAISQAAGDSGGSSTPLTVLASGMAKWLELYSGLLLIRVLLSWFPNIDWERQPLQAVRDMSDPYLNLFRNIMPPFFGALDLSPMLAFLVLGMLTSLLNTTVFA